MITVTQKNEVKQYLTEDLNKIVEKLREQVKPKVEEAYKAFLKKNPTYAKARKEADEIQEAVERLSRRRQELEAVLSPYEESYSRDYNSIRREYEPSAVSREVQAFWIRERRILMHLTPELQDTVKNPVINGILQELLDTGFNSNYDKIKEFFDATERNLSFCKNAEDLKRTYMNFYGIDWSIFGLRLPPKIGPIEIGGKLLSYTPPSEV